MCSRSNLILVHRRCVDRRGVGAVEQLDAHVVQVAAAIVATGMDRLRPPDLALRSRVRGVIRRLL